MDDGPDYVLRVGGITRTLDHSIQHSTAVQGIEAAHGDAHSTSSARAIR